MTESAVKSTSPLTPPRRWLAFLDCASVDVPQAELPALQGQSTEKLPSKSTPDALSEGAAPKRKDESGISVPVWATSVWMRELVDWLGVGTLGNLGNTFTVQVGPVRCRILFWFGISINREDTFVREPAGANLRSIVCLDCTDSQGSGQLRVSLQHKLYKTIVCI